MWNPLFDWLRSIAQGFWALLQTLIPAPPPALADACAAIAAAGAWLSPVLGFAPWQALAGALGIVLACALAGLGIVLARIVASFASAGGGGT